MSESLRHRADRAWSIICGAMLAAGVVAIIARMAYWNAVYVLAGVHLLTGWLLGLLGIDLGK